jgi:replicative DNA helicase
MSKNSYYNNAVSKKPSIEGILGKTLPAHTEAERAVLGALLLNDEYISTISEIIVPDDFYTPAHKMIYQAIIEIAQKHKRIDIVTLQDELVKKDQLEAIGGVVYLLTLQEDIPSVGLIIQHATIIKEKSVLRQLINSAATIITNCYTQDQDSIDAVLDDAEKVIFNISNKRSNNSFIQLDIWLKKTFQHLSDIKSHTKGITGVPSGFQQLDEMTSGFQNSDLIVLAARPAMGKTALALGIALAAARHGFSTGVFSLEMSAEQLTLRLLATESGIGHHNIRNATISSDEWIDLTNVAAQLAEMKIFIDDTAMLNIMDLRAKARKLKVEHGLNFLVVDYLQLLHSNKKHENRHQ